MPWNVFFSTSPSFSIIQFSFFITCFFFFKCFSSKKRKIRKTNLFTKPFLWRFTQEMFPTLSTWLNCLVKKKGFLSLRKKFFILSLIFTFFLWEWRLLLLPFWNSSISVSLWFFFFFLLLLLIEGKNLLAYLHWFLSSSLHFFICSSPFFFTLFSLCFSLSSCFFILRTHVFLVPSSIWFKLFFLSFFPFFCLLSHLQFRVFQLFRTKKNLRIEMSTCFFQFLLLTSLFSNK